MRSQGFIRDRGAGARESAGEEGGSRKGGWHRRGHQQQIACNEDGNGWFRHLVRHMIADRNY